MKPRLFKALALTLLFAGIHLKAFAQPGSEEQHLIQVLQSDASLAEKDAACARLKRIGTPRSVPALSALLRNDQLSHSARYALESMASAEAEAALVSALGETTGTTRVGIINSLGFRHAHAAAPALARLLGSSDSSAALASARALGQIGGPEAQAALQSSLKKSSGQLHAAVVDALLHYANTLLASAGDRKALGIFEKLYNAHETDFVRQAAYRGIILTSGEAGLSRMRRAILEGPGPEQAAALQLVRELQVQGATPELAKLLPKVRPEVQTALVEGLTQRADPAALPYFREMASAATPEVRLAIIDALGSLGTAQDIALLSGCAASGIAGEQNAARRALSELRGENVTDTLLAQLATAKPAIQAELARALGYRGDQSAVPKLLDLAGQPTDSVRKASLNALAQLIDPAQLTSLVELVLQARDDTARTEAAEALNSAYQRFQANKGTVPTAPLVAGLNRSSPEGRAALLALCSGLAFPEIRLAMRAALKDPNPQVKMAAARSLCDTADPELLDDLVHLAHVTQQESLRTLAFGGSIRLATQEEPRRLSHDGQVAVLKTLLEAEPTVEQKRMVLAGLAEVPTAEALSLVEPLLAEETVRNEAARAAVKIGLALPGNQAQSALAVLHKALDSTADAGTRQAVVAALKQIEASADYITDWQVSGPFRLAGKDYAALFDIPFAPEVGDGSGATWKTLSPGGDLKRPGVIDLLKSLGGEQCVAYARTWIHSDQEQPTRLELGADDGVKVWLNSKQVYALNTARPLQPGSDKVDLTLQAGWNLLLLKVTQNNQGWEFCARFLKPDGSHVEGLRWAASGAPVAGSGH